ncbi:MAG: PEP-CTERM sorting domain-containing protein [Planctomycetota bacterium]|jgi:hypothetical protein
MATAIAVVLLVAATAPGSVMTYGLDHEFSGATEPEGPGPWLTMMLDDGDTPGSVTFTLATTSLTETEFVSLWYVNVDPALDATSLIFSETGSAGTFTAPSITVDPGQFSAAGADGFDIEFDFANGGASKRFTAGDSVTYTVTGIPTLTVGSFTFQSDLSESGQYVSAAHVQGIQDEYSGWIGGGVGAPEPMTLGLLAFGFVAMLRRRR